MSSPDEGGMYARAFRMEQQLYYGPLVPVKRSRMEFPFIVAASKCTPGVEQRYTYVREADSSAGLAPRRGGRYAKEFPLSDSSMYKLVESRCLSLLPPLYLSYAPLCYRRVAALASFSWLFECAMCKEKKEKKRKRRGRTQALDIHI